MVTAVRRNIAWMAASQAGLFVLQFGSSLVVARLLTPYDMGVFTVATAVVGLLSIVRSLGLTSYLVRAATLDDSILASVFTINAAIAVAVAAAIAAVGALGGVFLHEPGVQRVLLVLAVVPLLAIFEFLPASGVEREGDFRAIAAISTCCSVVGTAVMLAFAVSGFSYMSLAYGQVAGSVTSLLAFNVAGRRHARFALGVRAWREVGAYGMQILAISGVNVLAARLAEVLLGRVLGLGALGLYSRASGLNMLVWNNVHLVIARVMFVEFSDRKRAGLSLRDSYLRTVRLVTALLWPAFAGMAVIAGPLVSTLYGPVWVGAAVPFSLLSLSALVLVSITMTWEVFVVCQETARQARFEFVRAGVGFALFAAGCFAGLTGAAAARVGEALFSVVLYRPHLRRMTDTAGNDFVPIYLQSAGLTAVAIAPAAATMSWYGWSVAAPLPSVLAAVAAGVAGWAALLVATDHPLAAEGRAWLRGERALLPQQR